MTRPKAAIVAQSAKIELDAHDLALLLNLLEQERNRLTACWAYQAATETKRRRIDRLQKGLGLIEGLVK